MSHDELADRWRLVPWSEPLFDRWGGVVPDSRDEEDREGSR